MGGRTSFLASVGLLSAARAIAGLLFFVYTLLAARFLGVSGFGLFQAVMGLFGMLAAVSVPLNLATLHAVSVSPADARARVVGSFLRLAGGGAGVGALGVVLLSPWLSALLGAPGNSETRETPVSRSRPKPYTLHASARAQRISRASWKRWSRSLAIARSIHP